MKKKFGVVVPKEKLPPLVKRALSVRVVRESLRVPKVKSPAVVEAYQCFKSVPAVGSVNTSCTLVEVETWRAA